MTFRMRPASHNLPQARICRRMRPQNNSAGLPSPMFPPTSLAAGVPAAHRPTETHNGFGQGVGVRGRGLARKASPMPMRFRNEEGSNSIEWNLG